MYDTFCWLLVVVDRYWLLMIDCGWLMFHDCCLLLMIVQNGSERPDAADDPFQRRRLYRRRHRGCWGILQVSTLVAELQRSCRGCARPRHTSRLWNVSVSAWSARALCKKKQWAIGDKAVLDRHMKAAWLPSIGNLFFVLSVAPTLMNVEFHSTKYLDADWPFVCCCFFLLCLVVFFHCAASSHSVFVCALLLAVWIPGSCLLHATVMRTESAPIRSTRSTVSGFVVWWIAKTVIIIFVICVDIFHKCDKVICTTIAKSRGAKWNTSSNCFSSYNKNVRISCFAQIVFKNRRPLSWIFSLFYK